MRSWLRTHIGARRPRFRRGLSAGSGGLRQGRVRVCLGPGGLRPPPGRGLTEFLPPGVQGLRGPAARAPSEPKLVRRAMTGPRKAGSAASLSIGICRRGSMQAPRKLVTYHDTSEIACQPLFSSFFQSPVNRSQ